MIGRALESLGWAGLAVGVWFVSCLVLLWLWFRFCRICNP